MKSEKKKYIRYDDEDVNERMAIKLSNFFIGLFIFIIVITLALLPRKEIKMSELFSTSNSIYVICFSLLSFFLAFFQKNY